MIFVIKSLLFLQEYQLFPTLSHEILDSKKSILSCGIHKSLLKLHHQSIMLALQLLIIRDKAIIKIIGFVLMAKKSVFFIRKLYLSYWILQKN